jgi:hypothetical protein
MKRVHLNFLVIAVLVVSAMFMSCKKIDDDKKKEITIDSNKVDVYVAGVNGNFAKLWKNGVAQNLTDGTCYAEARSVFVVKRNK